MTADETRRMAEERHVSAEAAKRAWIAGFTAARHWPNHPIPVLEVEWEGSTPRIVPRWQNKMRGYIG